MSSTPTIIPLFTLTRAILVDDKIEFEFYCAKCYKWMSANKAVHLSKFMKLNPQSDPRIFCSECGDTTWMVILKIYIYAILHNI